MDVRCHVFGAGPVCLVHPGGPGFHWEYLRMPLLERQVTTVYVEPIGTGASPRLPTHPNGYTRERYAEALDAVIDRLGVPSVHLLGHSHGGFVAQYYASLRPGRLAGVILYDSAPATGPEHYAEAARNLELFAARHAGDPRLDDVLAAWREVPAIAADDAFTDVARRLFPVYFADYWAREQEFDPIRRQVSGSYISGLDDCLSPVTIDDRDRLALVEVPALVVAGRHDFICGPRWAGQMHKLLPDAELEVLEDSGHFGHLEQPARFAEVVSGFVRRTAR
ncbi:alpha/beta fold hydrolase [Dactylosporangium sucinum]|uniref:Alpha/beta hydrolase n=1 Tax=Dactylosporangium sucinum TaxID=1424081 RepID=A0A917UD39_9ACTN|nr:alpha/beta hydrolase [Dactylosporangium sucinum]GGM83491.1 alpha/beta hydrolase [Dactylosporangium sucinum]